MSSNYSGVTLDVYISPADITQLFLFLHVDIQCQKLDRFGLHLVEPQTYAGLMTLLAMKQLRIGAGSLHTNHRATVQKTLAPIRPEQSFATSDPFVCVKWYFVCS